MNDGRNLTGTLQELKDELRDFAVTRYELLANELKHKYSIWKTAMPMLAIAVLLGATAFVVLTFGLVALVAALFGTLWGWLWGALIVGSAYLLLAAVIGFIGYREVNKEGVAPRQTLTVLRQDKVWLQEEARSA